MHSCITLNEILSVIFEHFFVTADASTLAALARTCHTFTGILYLHVSDVSQAEMALSLLEPALDVLWRELYTLSPLLQCMPTDLWVLQKGIQSHRKELCFCKPLADADWSRVNYYKPRIRALGQTVFRSGTISWHAVCTQTLRELSFYQPSTSLLPNLHTLNFRILPIDAVPFARMLLGPRITEITVPITSEDAEQSVELLSSLLPYISPDIVRLNISSITGITKPCSSIFQLIEGLHKLSDLHIDVKHRGLHERVTAQLGRLSSLSRLKISVIHFDQLRFYTTALGQFPVLTEFSFGVDDWTAAATIMDSMHCRFTNLAVVTHKQGSLSELRTFTESVSRHPSTLSLTHLSLTDFETTCDTDGQSYVEDIFRKLFALSGLTSIILQIDVSSNLRNSWYMDAAAAWPLLEALSISSPDMGPIKAKMTLAGLIPIVEHCTKLKTIRLRLDAQPFDPTQVNDISNSNIRRLCLETYIIPSPRNVFLSLIKIFPNLEYVFQTSHFTASFSWPWDEVNHMLHEAAVYRRGPCIVAWSDVECACRTEDSEAGPVRTRPKTPGSVQLRAVIDSFKRI